MNASRKWNEREVKHSPRVKMALRLYGSGAVTSMSEAARLAGCAASTAYVAKLQVNGLAMMERLDRNIEERSVSMSAVIAALGQKAVERMEKLMDHGTTEQIQFQAAKDLLDRNPETSKHSKLQVDSFTIDGRDAAGLAAAMVEAARVRSAFAEEVRGDYVKLADSTGGTGVPAALQPVQAEAQAGSPDVTGTDRTNHLALVRDLPVGSEPPVGHQTSNGDKS